ncbi:hypothetical protein ACLNGM_20500 [Aureimonas phyllosphaerae]|uniref:hypothetical protein n=1 Tax=Aureimonas phyllosphaerae TaxID=1166078 RepID=UPI003A5BFA55
MWLNDRLGAATKWRPILYLVGWALIGAALVAAFNSFTAHPPPSWKGRISSEFLLFHAGFISIAVAMGLSLLMTLKHRRWRFMLGPALNAPLVILTVLSGQLFAANFPDPVCGREVGCFVLGVSPATIDIVFEIWRAPCAYSLFLTRFGIGIEMNYSEDGSYLSNPHLLLSGNERILVLARGGYLVDAFEISTGRIMSDFVSWAQPDRDAAMLGNSEAIRRLLDENK